jgi:hypothetical protein
MCIPIKSSSESWLAVLSFGSREVALTRCVKRSDLSSEAL